MNRHFPAVSICVHPRGWTDSPQNIRQSGRVMAFCDRVRGVHPPDGNIAQGTGGHTHPLRPIVASEGWTGWTEIPNPKERPGEALILAAGCPPRGWTQMDTVDSSGWSA